MKRELLKDYMTFASALSGGESSAVNSKPLFKGVLYERYVDDFGNEVLNKVGENTVVVGGAIMALEHLCGFDATWKPATLNEIYNINPDIPGDAKKSLIALFGAQDYHLAQSLKRILREEMFLILFRYVLQTHLQEMMLISIILRKIMEMEHIAGT